MTKQDLNEASFPLFLSVSFILATNAQKDIEPSETANHVGDSVTITGRIMGCGYLSDSKGAPTLLNMGAAYPNQHLTLVIWGENRSQFNVAPEKAYNNKAVKVTSRVTLYRDKPQIVLTNEKQITILPEPLALPPSVKD